MTIKEILIQYSKELENISDTPRLDVEMLLKKALGDVDSMYIRMYLDKQLTEEQEKYFLEMIKERFSLYNRHPEKVHAKKCFFIEIKYQDQIKES